MVFLNSTFIAQMMHEISVMSSFYDEPDLSIIGRSRDLTEITMFLTAEDKATVFRCMLDGRKMEDFRH
jgi:hypothetical protein